MTCIMLPVLAVLTLHNSNNNQAWAFQPLPLVRKHAFVATRHHTLVSSSIILAMAATEKGKTKARKKKANTIYKKKKRKHKKKHKRTDVVSHQQQQPQNTTAAIATSPEESEVPSKLQTRLQEMDKLNAGGEKLSRKSRDRWHTHTHTHKSGALSNPTGILYIEAFCDSMLGACVASNEWDSVLQVLEVMKSQGLSQERSTYRACLQACFESGNGASASEILDAMTKALIEPGPLDISLVVATMCKAEQKQRNVWWQRALRLLRSSAPTTQTDDTIPVEAYDAVLSCLVSHPTQWRVAVRLLYSMEQGFDPENQNSGYHPPPALSTYRSVVECCVAANEPEQAFQVLTSMTKRGLKVRNPSHFALPVCFLASLFFRVLLKMSLLC